MPRHFVVQIEGAGFLHSDHGPVRFITSRGVTAPDRENAVAQLRALVPVQLSPYGEPSDCFDVVYTVVREASIRDVRRLSHNGFIFAQSDA